MLIQAYGKDDNIRGTESPCPIPATPGRVLLFYDTLQPLIPKPLLPGKRNTAGLLRLLWTFLVRQFCRICFPGCTRTKTGILIYKKIGLPDKVRHLAARWQPCYFRVARNMNLCMKSEISSSQYLTAVSSESDYIFPLSSDHGCSGKEKYVHDREKVRYKIPGTPCYQEERK